MSSVSRTITRLIAGQATHDGAGVKLTRFIGGPQLPELDPFLLLDHFSSDRPDDYLAGFPEHPHRGFETVTYMLAGRMRHHDNHGHSGLLQAGGVQWMTAGRGIVHSEMPEQENGLLAGFQLWLNLPAQDKMRAPRYQEFPAAALTRISPQPGVSLTVIAGEVHGVRGPVQTGATAAFYVDMELAANQHYRLPLAAALQGFIQVFAGAVRVGPEARRVQSAELAVLGEGDTLELLAGAQGARLLVIAGRPLQEPVARYGPFVMNTHSEIRQAISDYQNGLL